MIPHNSLRSTTRVRAFRQLRAFRVEGFRVVTSRAYVCQFTHAASPNALKAKT